MILQLSITILTFSPVVRSFSTFTPNCTTANETINIINGPNSRSTWDILFSSLFTIIACTWTIQHLNVPEQRYGRDPGFWGDQKWIFKRLWRSTKWMLGTIVAPEWILGVALDNFLSALESKRMFGKLAEIDGVEWTLKHGFYANMGGFAIRVKSSPEKGLNLDHDRCLEAERFGAAPLSDGKERTDSSNTTHNAVVFETLEAVGDTIPTSITSDKGSVLNNKPQTQGDMVSEVIFHLTSSSLLRLREEGFIKKLPQMTSDEIDDRSKSDLFTKAITIVQVFSIILQVIVRRATNLAISQLELAVTAFSVCAMIIYSVTLCQPKGVQTVHVLQNDKEYLTFENAYSICIAWREIKRSESHFRHGGFDEGISWEEGEEVKNYNPPSTTLAAIVFGALHCCGWFFLFPTWQELLLWRIACVVTTIIPLLIFILFLIGNESSWYLNFEGLSNGVVLTLYVFARIYIMVEVFRTLFYLPPDAFISAWPSSIPQFS